MATTLFPTSTVVPVTSFATADTRLMNITSRGSGVVSQADATVASLVTAANPQSTGSVAPWKRAASITLAAAGTVESSATIGASLFWVTYGVAPVTISGTITANLRAAESNTAANYAVGCKLYKVNAGGNVAAAFAQGSNTTELGTTEGASSISLTPTSTVFADGDRIGALIFYCSPSGSTSASGRTATGFWNGVSSAASGDTFFTFTETIQFRIPRQAAVSHDYALV
jgi:hypothetical protein